MLWGASVLTTNFIVEMVHVYDVKLERSDSTDDFFSDQNVAEHFIRPVFLQCLSALLLTQAFIHHRTSLCIRQQSTVTAKTITVLTASGLRAGF